MKKNAEKRPYVVMIVDVGTAVAWFTFCSTVVPRNIIHPRYLSVAVLILILLMINPYTSWWL